MPVQVTREPAETGAAVSELGARRAGSPVAC
jgi:hypothetical protein